MQKISLPLVTAGMILARDVYRGELPVGMPVCGKGTALTDELIARFDKMDVQAVFVEGHPVREEGELSLDDHLGDLDNRFAKTIHEPLNAMLHEIIAAHLTKTFGGDSDL